MNQDRAGKAEGEAGSFAEMWTRFAAEMMRAAAAASPGSPPPEAARSVRDAMLRAMGEYCDAYFRSPEFIDLLKRSFDNAIAFRQEMNTFLGNIQHQFQNASRQDVDQTMAVLRHLERRIVDVAEKQERQMGEIAQHLRAVAAMMKKAPAAAGARAKPPKSKKRKAKR